MPKAINGCWISWIILGRSRGLSEGWQTSRRGGHGRPRRSLTISVASMGYRVNFAASAEEDLEYLYQWVAAQAPLRGPEWFKGLERAIHSLQKNPYRCPLAPENYHPDDGIRHGARRSVPPPELGSLLSH